MSESVAKTTGVRKGAVGRAEREHDALTVAAVTAYLEEILTKRPKRKPNTQTRTFNVRIALGLGESQKLAYYCRKANMAPGRWLAMQAQGAVYRLKETDDNWKEIHEMCVEVIRRTEPGRAVILTPENARTLQQAAEFLGDGETPDNIVNEFSVGGHGGPLGIVEDVLGGCDRPEAEVHALLKKAREHFREEDEA